MMNDQIALRCQFFLSKIESGIGIIITTKNLGLTEPIILFELFF